MTKYSAWTKEEIDVLRRCNKQIIAGKLRVADIASVFPGRTLEAIADKMYTLGLRCTAKATVNYAALKAIGAAKGIKI